MSIFQNTGSDKSDTYCISDISEYWFRLEEQASLVKLSSFCSVFINLAGMGGNRNEKFSREQHVQIANNPQSPQSQAIVTIYL
jgi:hypothetical protein